MTDQQRSLPSCGHDRCPDPVVVSIGTLPLCARHEIQRAESDNRIREYERKAMTNCVVAYLRREASQRHNIGNDGSVWFDRAANLVERGEHVR